MGWWAKEIMSGDSPLDVEDEIFGILDLEKYPDDPHPEGLIATRLTEKQKILRKNNWIKKDPIGKQVLGYLMITNGAQMDPETKAMALRGCEEDEWSREDEERAKIVQNFREAIENYDGTPVEFKRTGLFEKIYDHLSSGGTGLVNENGPS